jgi:hypothetical protein
MGGLLFFPGVELIDRWIIAGRRTAESSPQSHNIYGRDVLQWRLFTRGIMKKRYLYSLLFGIPGLFVAGIISIVLFGDDPWPPFAELILSALFVLVVLALWMGSILLGYRVGKGLETDPRLNRNHVLISAGLTILFLLFMVLQQFSVGNIGPKSDTVLCSEFCARHGYSGSGMPPETSGDRICSCYDETGNEALAAPLDHLDPDRPK